MYLEVIYVPNTDTVDVLIRTPYIINQCAVRCSSIITLQRMNYSDFHKNRVRYNINTTNKDKSNIFII